MLGLHVNNRRRSCCVRPSQPATLAFETLTPDTMASRVAVVLLAVAILIGTLVLAKRLGSSSFFHGFLVAVGVFLSLHIVVVHWIFQLHRVTAPDAWPAGVACPTAQRSVTLPSSANASTAARNLSRKSRRSLPTTVMPRSVPR